eukprot:5682979-Pleurochrysis_carterae.AAC.2
MERARKLYSVYHESYVFPTWVVNDFMTVMQKFGSRTKVYFSNPQLQEVQSFVARREPVRPSARPMRRTLGKVHATDFT